MKQYLYDYELNLGVGICLLLGDYIKIIYIEHLIIKLMKISPPPPLLNELVPGYVVTYCLGVQAPAFTKKKKKMLMKISFILIINWCELELLKKKKKN